MNPSNGLCAVYFCIHFKICCSAHAYAEVDNCFGENKTCWNLATFFCSRTNCTHFRDIFAMQMLMSTILVDTMTPIDHNLFCLSKNSKIQNERHIYQTIITYLFAIDIL